MVEVIVVENELERVVVKRQKRKKHIWSVCMIFSPVHKIETKSMVVPDFFQVVRNADTALRSSLMDDAARSPVSFNH